MFTYTAYTENELTELNKFIVYLNYLESLSTYLDSQLYIASNQYNLIVSSKAFLSIRSKSNHAEIDKIDRLLRSAWFTEIQLNFNKNNPEYAKYSNHWACVQVYYAVYLAFRALFVSMKLSTSHSHTPTLKQVSAEIKQNPELFASPWHIICTGDTKDSSHTYLNLPTNLSINKISPLANTTKFFDSYALLLKTTRAKIIEEKRKDWLRQHKRKKQPNQNRQEMIVNMPPTTIFDFLYRLRIRSNYKDAEPFLIAIDDKRASQFSYSLRNITHHLLQQIELLTAKHLGKKQYNALIAKFTKNAELTKHSLVESRWKFLSQLF